MERFVYEEGELEFGDSQCSLCIYFDKNQCRCKLIGEIPENILSDDVTCDKYTYEGSFD